MDQGEYFGQGVSQPPALSNLPPQVEIYEVGPRDGLQNERTVLAADDKVRLIHALMDAGLRHIEVTSFVSPRWIPQLSDAERVLAKLVPRAGVTFSALVPNLKGLARARDAGLREVAVFLSATDSHSKKNINKGVNEAIATSREVAAAATSAGLRVRAYLSTAWGCPYEGRVPVRTVTGICRQLVDCGIYQLSLGDTIGVGTPGQTAQLLAALFDFMPPSFLALHLHDTRGMALANALVGLSMGITTIDASVGGLGGCPYAPGAAGNLATEDLAYMLAGTSIRTGIDLNRLVEAGALAQTLVGHKLSGKYLQAALSERHRPSMSEK